jgi:hypothetical protein
MHHNLSRWVPHAAAGRTILIVCLCVALLLGGALPAAAQTQSPPAGCNAIEPATLRDELNRVSQAVFAGENVAGAPLVDMEALAARQWALVGMDAAIDAAVAAAVVQVRGDTDLWNRFLSGWSPSLAEDLTRQVADIAFTSPGFLAALDALSAGIATELAAAVATLSAESATEATLCLQEFITARYSAALVSVFTREIEAETTGLDLTDADAQTSGIVAVLDRHKSALGGVGVIIAGQVAKRIMVRLGQSIAKRVAGRIVGRVIGKAGSTLVPAVGWVVGAALIAYDLLESRDGALPQIQAGLTGAEAKAALRAEITGTVATELRLEMPQLARDIANDLYASWLDFQRKYAQVLTLAATQPQVAALLNESDDPGKLATLVDAVLAGSGQPALDAALADGSFTRALDLPETAYALVAASGSLDTLLAWADVAGSRLADVVRLELYKHKAPGDLSRDDLLALLAVNDPAAIATLALLDAGALTRLLALSTPHLVALARTLSAAQLSALAATLAELDQTQANDLVAAALDDPGVVARLDDAGVRRELAASGSVAATLRFLTTPVSPAGLAEDALQLATGAVGFGLFRAKYGWWVALGVVGVPVLLVLGLLQALLGWLIGPLVTLARGFRWLFRRRPSPGKQ